MTPPARNPSPPIRVGLVEDADAYREHLAALLNGADGFHCSGAHATAESAFKLLAREKPDVLLLDLELPRANGDDCIGGLKQKLPSLEILVLTIHETPQRIFKALEAGASGYLIKPVSPARLLEAIAELRSGGAPMSSQIARLVIKTLHQRGQSKMEIETLTPREDEILKLLSEGHPSKEIADALRISPRTVSTHLHHIYEKLHVASRAQAVAKFLRR
jgi:DNA-binding NarL/FixJ family response regulator